MRTKWGRGANACLVALSLAGGAVAWPGPAAAAAPEADAAAGAARAFANGQSAQLAGDNRLAAEQFELANQLKPAAVALRSAARARYQAGNHARAATHALALRELYPDDEESVQLADEIIATVGGELTELVVTCSEPCTLLKDGKVLTLQAASEHKLFTRPGAFELSASFEAGSAEPQPLEAAAGEKLEASFEAPEVEEEVEPLPPPEPLPEPILEPVDESPEPVDDEPGRRKVHPGWAYAGMAVTAGLGGVTVWSALDTRSAHERYEDDATRERWQDGRTRQLRTNVLIGATAAVGVATIILAAVGTDWKRGRRKREQARLQLGPMGLKGRF